MTNYTFEERKIIAEFLENEVLKNEYQVQEHPDDDFKTGFNSVVDSSVIRNLIHDLTSCKFADIKHQVGVKFKTGEFNDEKYAIGFDKEYQCYQLINLMTFSINDLSLIEDTDLVEVINETETN